MNDAADNRPDPDPQAATGKGTLVRDVVLYSLARMLLVVVLAALILYIPRAFDVEIPLVIAALFGVLIALPLSLVLFAPLRRRVNEGIADVDARRRADRADLEARLRGQDGR
ncbi:MAG: DUF4229 domain-containing protein [Rhodococcus sp. (in: high G+C Gram-positive bacteria)]|uniref:DUF4229 domain-containing protein n=1 Tax=Rhodococcus sp. TaxID=1831 RepID=UPI003BB581AD